MHPRRHPRSMADAQRIGLAERAESASGRKARRGVDPVLADLAGAQHGVVARRQLQAAVASRQVIQQHVSGHLERLHAGVYAVGHGAVTIRGRWMAAVLACGPQAVLSHRAAAALWDLRPVPAGAIDVSGPGRRDHPGSASIRSTWSRTSARDRHGVPVTTPARTLFDLAAVLTATWPCGRRGGSPASRRSCLARGPARPTPSPRGQSRPPRPAGRECGGRRADEERARGAVPGLRGGARAASAAGQRARAG